MLIIKVRSDACYALLSLDARHGEVREHDGAIGEDVHGIRRQGAMYYVLSVDIRQSGETRFQYLPHPLSARQLQTPICSKGHPPQRVDGDDPVLILVPTKAWVHSRRSSAFSQPLQGLVLAKKRIPKPAFVVSGVGSGTLNDLEHSFESILMSRFEGPHACCGANDV
jgi:hypothetical protein